MNSLQTIFEWLVHVYKYSCYAVIGYELFIYSL